MYRVDLAGSYVNYGRLLDGLGEPAAALGWYAKAIPILEGVRTQVTHIATAQRYLGIAYWKRAEALTRLARNAEALTDWDRALALDDGSNRAMYRQQRALALARTGDSTQAVAEAEDLTQGDQVSGGSLYDAACICALSSAGVRDDGKRQETYALRAVAMLRRAQATGYFKDSQQVQHLKQDDDLAVLRTRTDFQKLLSDLDVKRHQ
jgi:tetratricopeptide (TPR) repeat protein